MSKRLQNQLLRTWLANHDEACPACGYNLRGLIHGICPECGSRLRLCVGFRKHNIPWLIVLSLLAGALGFQTLHLALLVRLALQPPLQWSSELAVEAAVLALIAAVLTAVWKVRTVRPRPPAEGTWIPTWLINASWLAEDAFGGPPLVEPDEPAESDYAPGSPQETFQ